MGEIARIEVDGVLLETSRDGAVTKCIAYRDGRYRGTITIDLAEGDELPPQETIEGVAYVLATIEDGPRERRAAREVRDGN